MAAHSRTIIAAVVTALSVSCAKENAVREDREAPSIVLDVSVSNLRLSAGSRAAYGGAAFAEGQTLGLCICVHEDSPSAFEPYASGYGNIRVTRTSDSSAPWKFYNGKAGIETPVLYLTTRKDSVTADIFAYAPYMDGVSDLHAIPVDFSSNRDIMRAVQNDSVTNRNLDPYVMTGDIRVPLTFRHYLSRLSFGFRTEYAGSNHLIDWIMLKRTGARTTPLYSSATFDALTGGLGSLTPADSLAVTFGGTDSWYEDYGNFQNNSGYSRFDYLLCPVDYAADGDFTVVFSIDGFRYEYAIQREDVRHGGPGGDYGFKAGVSYDFNFQLDNYVHLKGVSIQSDWTAGEMEGVL